MNWFNKKTSEEPIKKRNYDASKMKLINSRWGIANFDQDALLRASLPQLQARCRDAVRNNEYASKAQSMVKNNVVGPTGIRLRAQSKNNGGTIDIPAVDAIEREWRKWGRVQYAHISKRYSWIDIQNLVVGSVFVDGEAFVKMHRGTYASDPYGFSLQLIDPVLIDVKYDVKNYNGNTIVGGIEYDNYSRPVAYWVAKSNPTRHSAGYNIKNEYTRIPATDMLHIYIPISAESKRGQPTMVAGLENLYNLSEYKKSALLASKLGAAKSIFLTEDEQADSLTPEDVEDLEDGQQDIIDWNVESLTSLPPGVGVETFDPTYPHQLYADFIKTNLQSFASACNISYNSLANDLSSVNFSSLRVGKTEERIGYMCLQNLLIEHLHIPVYEAWLKQQLIFDTITIGNTPLKATRMDKYAEVKFSPPSWAPLDSVKEAQADTINLANGTTTRAKIIAKAGDDPDELMLARKQEEERLKELGLTNTIADIAVPINEE